MKTAIAKLLRIDRTVHSFSPVEIANAIWITFRQLKTVYQRFMPIADHLPCHCIFCAASSLVGEGFGARRAFKPPRNCITKL